MHLGLFYLCNDTKIITFGSKLTIKCVVSSCIDFTKDQSNMAAGGGDLVERV